MLMEIMVGLVGVRAGLRTNPHGIKVGSRYKNSTQVPDLSINSCIHHNT